MLPSLATTCSRETASTLPTMSRMSVGRNFSTCVNQFHRLRYLHHKLLCMPRIPTRQVTDLLTVFGWM